MLEVYNNEQEHQVLNGHRNIKVWVWECPSCGGLIFKVSYKGKIQTFYAGKTLFFWLPLVLYKNLYCFCCLAR